MDADPHLVINNCCAAELKTILGDWLAMYVDFLNSRMTFALVPIGSGRFVIEVDKRLDDTVFFYMVNYFSMPIGFSRRFEVEGHTTATKHKRLIGKDIYIYIDPHDTEYDNVRITTREGETFKFNFAGRFIKMASGAQYRSWEPIDPAAPREIIEVDKKKLVEELALKAEEKSQRNANKRLAVLATLYFISIPTLYLVNIRRPYTQMELSAYMVSLAVSIWFLSDYRLFSRPTRVCVCLLLSLMNIAFGIYIHTQFAFIVATVPLSSIIVVLAALKFMGVKFGRYLEGDWSKLFLLALLGVSVAISVLLFKPLIDLIK